MSLLLALLGEAVRKSIKEGENESRGVGKKRRRRGKRKIDGEKQREEEEREEKEREGSPVVCTLTFIFGSAGCGTVYPEKATLGLNV